MLVYKLHRDIYFESPTGAIADLRPIIAISEIYLKYAEGFHEYMAYVKISFSPSMSDGVPIMSTETTADFSLGTLNGFNKDENERMAEVKIMYGECREAMVNAWMDIRE